MSEPLPNWVYDLVNQLAAAAIAAYRREAAKDKEPTP